MSIPPVSPTVLSVELQAQNAQAEALISSNPREALTLATQACEIARAHRITETVPVSLWVQGIAFGLLEQMQRSDVLLEEAVALGEVLGQEGICARSINGLGANAHRRGEYGKAFSHYHQYLSYARRVQDKIGEARALGNIGLLFHEMGEADRALEITREVLAIGIGLERWLLCVTSASNIADTLLARAEFQAVLEIVERWRPVAQREGFQIQAVLFLATQGAARLGLGDLRGATVDLEAAVAEGRRLGDCHEICGPLIHLGEAYHGAGRELEAQAVLDEAFARCAQAGAIVLQARASRVLMALHESQARFCEALKYARTVLRLQEGMHAERLSRRTEVLSVEFEIDRLRSQADLERQKGDVLRESNALLHRLQENLQHEATHDPLTGLVNRRYFLELLETTLAACRAAGTQFAIAYLDLDGFKAVNDTHGHHAGDALLAEIARRVLAAARKDDVVARLGGDEFAIILREIGRPLDAKHQALRLARVIREPFFWNGVHLVALVSVGVAAFPERATSAAELLHRADSAMYERKRRRQSFART